MVGSTNGQILFLEGRTIVVQNFQVGSEVPVASTEKESQNSLSFLCWVTVGRLGQ